MDPEDLGAKRTLKMALGSLTETRQPAPRAEGLFSTDSKDYSLIAETRIVMKMLILTWQV